MRVLVAHNFYQQPGGEDQVFHSELALLESHGVKAARFEVHNHDVDGMGKLALLGATMWNRDVARRLRKAVCANQADVVHFHNTFPLMSPSVYAAAHAEGAAVVQTLHNFRLLCAGACFYRDGGVCEKCIGKKVPLAGVFNKCYRGSAGASLVTAGMTSLHRLLGTWHDAVDAYITPTRFAREKFIAGGLPAAKITVKPNFVEPDPGGGVGGGGYAIYVGRLSHEKGIDTLLGAWDRIRDAIPLKIVGDGPLAHEVKAAAAKQRSIEWLGRRPMDEVLELIGAAEALVFPSNCYETFGRSAIEAFAKGTPVIASDHGAPADVVDEGRTGLRFTPGDASDLAAKVRAFFSNRVTAQCMRIAARAEYLAKYTGERNFEALMSIYRSALARRGRTDAPAPDRLERHLGETYESQGVLAEPVPIVAAAAAGEP